MTLSKNQKIQLNKYIANCGVCSRRKADQLIESGKVSVNGEVVIRKSMRIFDEDIVKIQNKIIKPEKKIYIILNKPKDCITTLSDERGRKTVFDLIKESFKERIYPVGRLDRNTTGLLLMTNDGDLAWKLSHPSNEINKTYQVTLTENFRKEDIEKLKKGIVLDDGLIRVDKVFYPNMRSRKKVEVHLHSGRNRIIRRMFAFLGYRVKKLDRTSFAFLTKKNIPLGSWRYLTSKEIKRITSSTFIT
jgi:23S rRNA pseudouridine2605 synthase